MTDPVPTEQALPPMPGLLPVPHRPAVPAHRRGAIARAIAFAAGSLLLLVALLLPYRARIAYTDWLGRCANALYTGYVRLVTWLLRRLTE